MPGSVRTHTHTHTHTTCTQHAHTVSEGMVPVPCVVVKANRFVEGGPLRLEHLICVALERVQRRRGFASIPQVNRLEHNTQRTSTMPTQNKAPEHVKDRTWPLQVTSRNSLNGLKSRAFTSESWSACQDKRASVAKHSTPPDCRRHTRARTKVWDGPPDESRMSQL